MMAEIGNTINLACLNCKTCSVILFEYQLTFGHCARLWGFKVK